MKKKTVHLFGVLLASAVALSGCAGTSNEEYVFKNAGFEQGTLSGWTAEGGAFTSACVYNQSEDEQGNPYYKEGEFFLYGGAAPEGSVGTLTSEPFKLKGNGRIGFLIGAGSDASKCYVAVCDTDGNELIRRGNDDYGTAGFYDSLHRVVIDASEYLGKEVVIKVVDSDSGSGMHNYINVDDFIVNYQGEEDVVSKTFVADKYIEENMGSVVTQYRHTYHAMPPVGWMNDPNGFSYAFGKYQLFYQFHPYSSAWGPMHWGHYSSEDFIKWELMPTAIGPDTSYDKDGCFSGTAIVKDGELYLMYTSVADGKQTQALAKSSDGVTFEKVGRVIGSDKVPANSSRADFRDPKVFLRGDSYYAVMGSKNNDGDGQLLLYKSADLQNWSYVGTVWKDDRTTMGIYECPDLAVIDGTDVLITSPQGFATGGWRYENVHSAIYMTGSLDTQSGQFARVTEDEIDSGFDFYAPQTLTAPDGRVIMIAWMQMWDRTMPTQAHGWAGAATLPRELTLKDGKLYQAPVREIEKYRKNEVNVTEASISGEQSFDGVEGTKTELCFTLDVGDAAQAGVKVFCGTEHETRIYYDRESGLVIFDRSDMGTRISGNAKELNASKRSVKAEVRDNKIEFRIFLDVSSCEVFLNGGERTMTGNVYSDPSDTGIRFFAEGGSARILSLYKYDIVVE